MLPKIYYNVNINTFNKYFNTLNTYCLLRPLSFPCEFEYYFITSEE